MLYRWWETSEFMFASFSLCCRFKQQLSKSFVVGGGQGRLIPQQQPDDDGTERKITKAAELTQEKSAQNHLK